MRRGVFPQGVNSRRYQRPHDDCRALVRQTLLTCVTFDEWATMMFAMMRANGAFAWLYFVLIVALGGFYVVNLFLAVIFKEFVGTKMVRRNGATVPV